MRLFIFSITLFSQCLIAYCKAETSLSLPFPHMVIVGGTGVGKSSLAMALIGEDVMCPNCTFPICPDTDSCTKQTSYAVAPWLGDPDNQNFTIVDTPGFSDSDGEEDALLEEMINVLNNEVKSANSIILAMDSTEIRFTDAVTKMLGQLEALFGRKMWNNTIIEMTKFSYSAGDIEERENMCENHPDNCKDETYWYTEINRQLEDKFHIGMERPMVFIDSWSQMDLDDDDPIEQEHFVNETQKLWDFTMTRDAFEFKSIDEVLEENEELRIENEKLNATNVALSNQVDSLEDTIDVLNNENEKLNATNVALTNQVDSLESIIDVQNDTIDILKKGVKKLNTANGELKEKNTNLTTEVSSLELEVSSLEDEKTTFLSLSAIRHIHVQIGNDGCRSCTVSLEITSQNDAKCTTGDLVGGGRDWLAGLDYDYYTYDDLSGCLGYQATKGVKTIKIHYSKGSGEVNIKFWRIYTDAGAYYCNGGTYDKGDSEDVTCRRGA